MRIILARVLNKVWLMLLVAVLFVVLFGFGSFYFSKVLPPFFFLSALSVIGFGATHFAFGDLESHFAVAILLVLSIALYKSSPSISVLVLGIPVGLIVFIAVTSWIDESNQEVSRTTISESKEGVERNVNS